MGALNVGSAEAMAKIQVMGGTPGVQQTKQGQEGADGASFKDLMNSIQTKQQSTSVVTELKGAGENKQPVNKSDKTNDTAAKPKDVKSGDNGSSDKSAEKTSNDGKQVKGDKKETAKTETGEKLEGAVEEIKDTIASKLDISDEDLEAVMETLSLTSLDLLNPQTIPQIVTEVNDTDMSAVIADEALSGTVQELMGEVRTTVADIAQELNMTPQEFAAAVEEAQAAPEASVPVETQEAVFSIEKNQDNLISDGTTP